MICLHTQEARIDIVENHGFLSESFTGPHRLETSIVLDIRSNTS